MSIQLIVMSDSHGYNEAIDAILEKYPKADGYIHCGDLSCPMDYYPELIVVKGNNDPYFDSPYERVVSFGNHRFFVTHSHRQGYHRYQGLYRLAKDNQCDVVLYGHTHVFDDTEYKGVRMVNPGSLWHNRDFSGPCYAIVTIDENSINIERKEVEDLWIEE